MAGPYNHYRVEKEGKTASWLTSRIYISFPKPGTSICYLGIQKEKV